MIVLLDDVLRTIFKLDHPGRDGLRVGHLTFVRGTSISSATKSRTSEEECNSITLLPTPTMTAPRFDTGLTHRNNGGPTDPKAVPNRYLSFAEGFGA